MSVKTISDTNYFLVHRCMNSGRRRGNMGTNQNPLVHDQAPFEISPGIPQWQAPAEHSVNITYFNRSNVPITVVERSGLRRTFPPSADGFGKPFVVEISHRTLNSVKIDARALSDSRRNGADPYTEKFCDMLEQGVASMPHSLRRDHVELTTTTRFTREYLEEHGGSVYVPSLDIVVSVLDSLSVPDHPGQINVRMESLATTDLRNPLNGFHYNIRIVDRAQHYGDRFVNIAGKVYRIKAITKDTGYPDGIYQVSTSPSGMQITDHRLDDNLANQVLSIRHSFEEGEKALALYRTHQEAASLGDPQAQNRRHLEELAYQLRRDEHAMAIERANLKQAEALRSAEIEREKAEFARERNRLEDQLRAREFQYGLAEKAWNERELQMKQQAAIERDRLDAASAKRKNTMEIVKYVPAGLTALWAIYKVVEKISSTK